jgi:transcriptional regulator with XRE-family HTH domain
MVNTQLNQKLRNFIEETGMTQTFVAKKSGIKPKRLNDICNNVVDVRADELLKICKVIKVDIKKFY